MRPCSSKPPLGPLRSAKKTQNIRIVYGLYRDNGKEHENYSNIIGYILALFRDYIGVMENKMETAI